MNFSIYGLLIGIGIAVIIWNLDSKFKLKIVDYILLLVLPLLGARILFIIHNINLLDEFFSLKDGGLALYGAIFGGLIGIIIVSRLRNIEILKLSDCILLFLPITQSLGRLGNYFNQELFGFPTKLPWGIFIDLDKRPSDYIEYEYFHPTFAYEIILNLINFIILWKFKDRKGFVTSIYLIIYGSIRFLINRIRIDGEYFLGIETSDLTSAIIIFIGIMLLTQIVKEKTKKKLAEIISIILSPFSITIVPFILIPFFFPFTQTESFFYLASAIIIGFTPILQFIIFKKLGIITDWNIPDREDRPLYTGITATIFLVSFGLSLLTNNLEFQALSLSISMMLYIMAFISFFWKISGHLSFFAFTLASTFLLINSNYLLLFFLLTPILIWSRLYLKHHDIYQTLAGCLLGVLTPLIIWFLFR